MAKSKPSPEERLSLETNPTDPKMTAVQALAALAYLHVPADLLADDRMYFDFEDAELSEDCWDVLAEQIKAHREEIREALKYARKWSSEWRWLELATMPYQDYLESDEWKQRREWVLEDAGHRCQVCNAPNDLHVHHRTYERRGCEKPGDLTVLCAECHRLFHEHGRVK